MIYKQLRPIDTRNFWPFILFFGQFSRIFHLLLVGMTIEPGNIGQQLLRLDRRSHSDRLALIRTDSACFTARVKPYPAKNCVRCSMGEAFDRLRPPESGDVPDLKIRRNSSQTLVKFRRKPTWRSAGAELRAGAVRGNGVRYRLSQVQGRAHNFLRIRRTIPGGEADRPERRAADDSR